MVKAPPIVINYEEKFPKTDKTDAVLIVDGNKLHVNKAVLSYHSDYFSTLFNSNSKKEFTIATEKIGDFATVLGSVHGVPNTPNFSEPTSIYKKALAQSDKTDAILVVDKKRLYVNKADLTSNDNYQTMSPSTKKKLFYRYLKI
ncbi:hypothetical protein CAEBREN_05936 [Caenorhabditis brenneri]|uniref:BTB domain-containing protein n=1 Tax=Caenorhabditis brenneri TaxID=135651 RepID=G0P568_CAEBE|nr:hypothetical protein CAEBREN_05936 [Caenorhabditis brenneri]